MKKAVKAGIIGAGALGYSIIPTYLMKYHWIIRDKKMAKKEEKVLYLTFDDGPDTVYTNKLLDLLDQEQVPAIFFMVAEAAQGHPDIVKRLSKELGTYLRKVDAQRPTVKATGKPCLWPDEIE